MPLAPHPVEHDCIFLLEIQCSELHDGNMLVRAVGTIAMSSHKSTAGLEDCIICDGVCPVMITRNKGPGSSHITVGERQQVSNSLPVKGNFPDKSFPFKIFRHHRFR
jgi:hypothetical protein